MTYETRVFNLVVTLGELLIECDSEALRVTETMNITSKALGLDNLDSFVTANGLFVTSKVDDKTLSLCKHIRTRDANLGKVESINSLSRQIANNDITLDEAEKSIELIRNQKTWQPYIKYLAAALGCGSLTVLYGGSYLDGLISLLISIFIRYLLNISNKHNVNRVVTNLFLSAVITILTLTTNYLGYADNVDKIIIGSIMPLVPGLLLTIGIKDITNNDYLSGIIRVIEALLIASSIAVGVGMVFHFI